MVRTIVKVLVAVAALVVLSAPASADTIITISGTGASCGLSNCFGNVLTLTIHPTGGSNYQVTLEINTTGNNNPGTGIGGVNFKFGTGITSASLVSFQGGSTAGWGTIVATGLNANTVCDSGGGASFGCSEDTAFANPTSLSTVALASLPHTGTYTWVWNVTAGGSVTANNVHIGAMFGHITQTKQGYKLSNDGIISAVVVPEPGTLALLGSGLLGLAGLVRRRFMA